MYGSGTRRAWLFKLVCLVLAISLLSGSAAGSTARNPAIENSGVKQSQRIAAELRGERLDKMLTLVPNVSASNIKDVLTPERERAFKAQAKKFSKDFLATEVRSYVTLFVLIGAQEVSRRASEHRQQLTAQLAHTEAQKIVVRDALWKQVLFSMSDGLAGFGGGLLANKIVAVLEAAMKRKVISDFFIATITSTAVSTLLGAADELIKASVTYLQENPNIFAGGLSDGEKTALLRLQQQLGPTYFLSGLNYGDPDTKSAYGKVQKVMSHYLMMNSGLRDALWSHIWRETILKGDTYQLIELTLLSSVVRTGLLSRLPGSRVGVFNYNLANVSISVGIGIVSTLLVPDWWSDVQTYYLRTGRAKLYQYSSKEDLQTLSEIELLMPTSSNLEKLKQILEVRRQRRQASMNLYLSLMKIMLDRAQEYMAESIFLNHEATRGFDLKRWLQDSGLDPYFMEIGLNVPARYNYDQDLITKYRAAFRAAAENLLNTYDSDLQFYTVVAKSLPEGPIKAAVIHDRDRAVVPTDGFLHQFVETIIPATAIIIGRVSPNPEQRSMNAALDSLSRMAFWGLREADVHAALQQVINIH